MSYIIEKSLISDLLDIQDDLKNIEKNLQAMLPDDSLLFDAKLIIDELICNGIRHGNKEKRDKLVDLLIEISEEYLKIEIKDEGNGFEYKPENYDPMSLALGGRGLKIVDGLSDEFYVQNNRVISIKYL